MYQQANPHTDLVPGVKILCGGHKGVIIQTNRVKDQFGRPINSFTVELTEKWIQGYRKYKEVDEKIVKTVNYSFIKYECK